MLGAVGSLQAAGFAHCSSGARKQQVDRRQTSAYFMESSSTMAAVKRAPTLYDVLGVGRQSELREIKSAYRHLARQSHPDVVAPQQREESTQQFLRIHAAYTTLSDPETRARYDLQLSLQSLPRYTMIRTSDDHPMVMHPSSFSPSSFSPSSFSQSPSPSPRTRSWETDQCW